MEKSQLSIVGSIVALIGCLTILLTWCEIDVEGILSLHYSYTGVTLITSGDFTDPNGIFYESGKLGVYTPVLITIAFLCMALRFFAKVKRTYFKDVVASGILIIIGSLYMVYWVGTGSSHTTTYVETHGFGAGPIVAIIVAIAGIIIARAIDNAETVNKTARNPQVQSYNGAPSVEQPKYFKYCSGCGHGLTEKEATESNYCKYCGAQIEKKPSESKTNDSPE